MRFIIMHKTTAHWEAGARPTPELIARVGGMIGELGKTGRLLGADGLRPSAEGVRVTFSSGSPHVVKGPFERGNELPSGFSVVRASSIEGAIEWASQHADASGNADVDIRPITEAWDIGLGDKPREVTTRRFMVLRKATPETEADRTRTSPAVLSKSDDAARSRGAVHLLTETMRGSARGRRYKNSGAGITVLDGPFAESKELIGGYIIISAESLDEADPWVRRYIAVVGAEEVDVRELE